MYRLLVAILGGWIIAYILTWLEIDQVLIKGAFELLKINISKEGFYFIIIVLGVICSIVKD